MAKTVKRTEPKEPTITVQARSDEATWSADDIIAKRLSGQPFGVRSDVIPMREPGKWALRVANSDVHESRHYDMTHKLGYLPVLSSDLAEGVTPESMGFRIAEDGQTLVIRSYTRCRRCRMIRCRWQRRTRTSRASGRRPRHGTTQPKPLAARWGPRPPTTSPRTPRCTFGTLASDIRGMLTERGDALVRAAWHVSPGWWMAGQQRAGLPCL